jgi:hypothetical protein
MVSGGVVLAGTTAQTTRAATAITTAIRGWHPQYPQYVNCDTPQAGAPESFSVATGSNYPYVNTVGSLAYESNIAWPRTAQYQNTYD